MTTRFMPPEWAPHDATWMGFPVETYPGTPASLEETQRAWADVANAIADHEPVHMLCNPQSVSAARKCLSAAVSLHEVTMDDAWLRDTGPTFVIDDNQLVAVDWRFNGWGDHTAFDWGRDAQLAKIIADWVSCPVDSTPLVNEGGGIHVDDKGTVLLTETVQLDAGRNPGADKASVEAEIHNRLGTERAVWLPRGLYRDYLDNGTRGHIDMVACFTPGGEVLLHQQQDTAHPDSALYEELLRTLDQAGLSVRALPAPLTTRDHKDWVDYSYINHYVLNGAVIVPTFADKQDGATVELLAELYPGRAMRAVDARLIFAMGGGIHCITQQQPALPTDTTA